MGRGEILKTLYDVIITRDNWVEIVGTFDTLDEAAAEYMRLSRIEGLLGVPDIREFEVDLYEQN